MSSFLPVQEAMDVDQDHSNKRPTSPDVSSNQQPMSEKKRIEQMMIETLNPQYRCERLKRLIFNSQQPSARPDPNFIANAQGNIMQPTWRRKVAEWLLEFVDEFGLPNDIVAVAVNYMDMYLSKKKVDKINLQLLAMVCIFVASKFHEVEAISIQELQTLAEGGYTEESIRLLEFNLLETLNWNMNPTTTHHIMRHVANSLAPEIRWNLLEHAEGFCDYALTDYSLLGCEKINVAVASVLCGLNNIGRSSHDEKWLIAELQNNVGVGVTFHDQQEITMVRNKLQAVFYKNFPHLKPNERALSPVGVDAFPTSRSNSPVHYHCGKNSGGNFTNSPKHQKFNNQVVSQNDNGVPTKITMVIGPTQSVGAPSFGAATRGLGSSGFTASSSSAFGSSVY
jgi:hypothetical protein